MWHFLRLSNWLLFAKLSKKHVLLIIISYCAFGIRTKQCFVLWGNTTSISFSVDNGAIQGGVISPVLFNVYIDDFITTLHCSGIGGYLSSAFLNHVCCADDLCGMEWNY